jgi:polar amino acid transport system substrate-binding protein
MRGRTWRFAFVLTLALGLAIGAGIIPQAQQKPYIVCSDIPWDPFEMVTAGGEYFGFDLDVMRMIAILKGYEIEIQNMAFDAIIPAVQAGKCDIGASGFTITAEREQVVDFSNPYWLSNQAVIVRRDSGFASLDDVFCCGHKIGAQRGTTGAAWVEDNLIAQGVDVELVTYETYPLAVLDLVNKRIDAVVQDEPASQQSIAAYPDVLTIVGIIETNEYFGFNVAEGDPQGLLPKLNKGMAELGLQLTLRLLEEGWSVKLQIVPGTPWDNLVRAYFGASSAKIEAAYLVCKDKLLVSKDVAGYAACMATETAK